MSALTAFACCALLVSLGLTPVYAGDEDTPVPKVGDHVRVSLSTGRPPAPAPRGIPRRVSLDPATSPQRGAGLIGLLAGVAAGVILLSSLEDTDVGPGTGAIVAPPLMGTVLGALLGSAVEHERWKPARQP